MHMEELKWLQQTMKNAETVERFVIGQYDRGRMSSQVLADTGRERSWTCGNANELLATTTGSSSEYTTMMAIA
jgi:hypothetical protein